MTLPKMQTRDTRPLSNYEREQAIFREREAEHARRSPALMRRLLRRWIK